MRVPIFIIDGPPVKTLIFAKVNDIGEDAHFVAQFFGLRFSLLFTPAGADLGVEDQAGEGRVVAHVI